jgi:hypothetical protein
MKTKESTVKSKTPAKTKKRAKKAKISINADQLNEKIRQRAHEISIERGHDEGDSLSDWLKAEKEIKKKYKQK